jgi:hypothetical protein
LKIEELGRVGRVEAEKVKDDMIEERRDQPE